MVQSGFDVDAPILLFCYNNNRKHKNAGTWPVEPCYKEDEIPSSLISYFLEAKMCLSPYNYDT
jgi:hypothetical protein